MTTPLQRLKHHVSGAIERGEAEPITEVRAAYVSPDETIERLEAQRDELVAALAGLLPYAEPNCAGPDALAAFADARAALAKVQP